MAFPEHVSRPLLIDAPGRATIGGFESQRGIPKGISRCPVGSALEVVGHSPIETNNITLEFVSLVVDLRGSDKTMMSLRREGHPSPASVIPIRAPNC
jgi:hypothetical protein